MSGLFPAGPADPLGTWVAAAVTLVVLAAGLGERRLFGVAQHLLAGLLTGLLVVLAVREVIVPRVVLGLADQPLRGELWIAAVLLVALVAAPFLPRRVAAVPVAVLVAGTAVFALAGAVSGTLVPQLAGAAGALDEAPATAAGAAVALVLTVMVLIGFLHGAPRSRAGGAIASAGRWVLLVGVGAFLGFLVVSRLALLVDRLAFLVVDWLGIGR